MFRTFLSQLLRNPVYAQADLELYEFFKSQGAAIVNDASDFAGTNGCYLYQGRDVKEDKDRCLKDQILVIAPHEALISSDTWLKCRKKLMANTTFQQGRKPKNTWLAGKIKCGHCGYALKAIHVPNSTGYFRCTKRTENKGCPGCGKIRKWCCTIKVDIENSKGQYIEKDKQEATKDGSESTKIQHGI